MSGSALAVWIVTLLIVAVVITPLALSLLARALAAARSIETYLADMREAANRIAAHTKAVPALDRTIETAVAMRPVAEAIEAKTGAVTSLLGERAGGPR